jgi:hypothetical protein
LGVEEVLEFVLEGAFAALEVDPDGVGFVVVVPGSGAAEGGGAAVEEDAVDVLGKGRGAQVAWEGSGRVPVFLVAVEHL